jgi:HupE/UreJ protein
VRTWARGLVSLMLALGANLSFAHEMTLAEMELRETRPGEFLWQWGQSGSKPIADVLTPRWPQGCEANAGMLRCGARGLTGVMSVEGVGAEYSAALVKVFWRDGQSRVYTLTGNQPTVHLYGSAEDTRGRGEIARAYLVLGVEHILSGIDHLMFVAALLFLVGFRRKRIWTISAFTLAHSLTLALSTLV